MRRVLVGVLLAALSIAVAAAAAALPIWPLVSDEPYYSLYPNGSLVVVNGVIEPRTGAMWPYFYNATAILVFLFFASFIASFFVEMGEAVRAFFAVISIAIAVFHYLSLVTMTNSLALYPLIYTITLKYHGNTIQQYYLDIGQIFIIYSIYNIWKLLEK
ncbi:MAG: hypothetical protein TU35_006230 [Thermoproteus sp. AZ2]|jgi:hypothetical protein|uniref:Uncharacterized protein n=1 Tax=Thermoproteus sp. AZ2 TaxID=1609232 RepID=A0ACC6V2G5_9CREN|nr:MAG: hypothetical protein TU35_06690 [Thermoproteus sp. AZ2]